jgi:hypothetical protein
MKWMRALLYAACPCFGIAMSEIPFDRMGIPEAHRKPLLPDAPLALRLAAAKGALPVGPKVAVGIAYVLLSDSDPGVQASAKEYLSGMPEELLLTVIERDTHPKLLEFLVAHRLEDEKLLVRISSFRLANPRTLRLIALHGSSGVVDAVALNQERLLLEPLLFLELEKNPAASSSLLQRVESFLRLHHLLDDVNATREPLSTPTAETSEKKNVAKKESTPKSLPVAPSGSLEMFDLDALGLGEKDSPGAPPESEDQFSFSFEEPADEFDLSLTKDSDENSAVEPEEKLSMEKQIAKMTVGQRIKLAYSGNLSTRKLLLRDANKLVSAAVVKSGRMTENETLKLAGNRNIPSEILNYIANDKATMRKYPIRAALATNPKTPVPIALKLLRDLSKGDLRALSMNRNVPGVVFSTAGRLYRQKFQK